jgi:hypothetical protein
MQPCSVSILVMLVFLLMGSIMYDILYDNVEAFRLLREKEESRITL